MSGWKFLKPIEGEEWIEKMRRREFWIGMRRRYPQKFYSRLTKGYVGWWLYFRLRAIWSRAALLIDPLSCGGFYSHLRCFLYNWIMVDVIWNVKHRIWKLFHEKEWEQQCAFWRACDQATEEGCADPMPATDWMPADRFHGLVLGKRYFERVAEILAAGKGAQQAKRPPDSTTP